MAVAQKFRPVFAVSQPAVTQNTTRFTPKVGHELMTHGYSKRTGAFDKTKKRLVWHVPSGRANTDVAQRIKSNQWKLNQKKSKGRN